jgi:hypothetical protein
MPNRSTACIARLSVDAAMPRTVPPAKRLARVWSSPIIPAPIIATPSISAIMCSVFGLSGHDTGIARVDAMGSLSGTSHENSAKQRNVARPSS